MAEKNCYLFLSLTGGIALTTVCALTCYTVITKTGLFLV